MNPDSAVTHAAIDQIRVYVRLHPHAADTCAGIAHWWLAGKFAPDVIEVALQQLHAMGELERIEAGMRQLWRRQRVPE